jgi:hypothetical protein
LAVAAAVAGYAETLDQLKRAEPIWLAVCFASQLLSYAAYVVPSDLRGFRAREDPRVPALPSPAGER